MHDHSLQTKLIDFIKRTNLDTVEPGYNEQFPAPDNSTIYGEEPCYNETLL